MNEHVVSDRFSLLAVISTKQKENNEYK